MSSREVITWWVRKTSALSCWIVRMFQYEMAPLTTKKRTTLTSPTVIDVSERALGVLEVEEFALIMDL